MSDLIERRAALDGISKMCFGESEVMAVQEKMIQYIKRIPSARSCETCRYNHLEWYEEPCDSCTGGGDNHWKPKEPEGDPCDGCKHRDKGIYDYPCDSCVHGGATCRWEDSYE